MWGRLSLQSARLLGQRGTVGSVRGYQSRLTPEALTSGKNLVKTEPFTEDRESYVVEDSTAPSFKPPQGVKLLGFKYPNAKAPDNKTFYAIAPRKPPMVLNGPAGEYVEKLYLASMHLDCLMQTERELVQQVLPLTLDEEITKKFFANTTIDVAEKMQAMERFAKESKLSKVVAGLLYEVVELGHTEHLGEIVNTYSELMKRVRCEATAEVTFGVTPSVAQLRRIKQLLSDLRSPTQYYVNTVFKVDPSIGGGLVLNVGDFELDGSLNTRCAEVQKHLSRSLQQ